MNWDAVWDILVRECGAQESMRADFVYWMVKGTSEYRFQGKLGFGGKYWPNTYGGNGTVSCYGEDYNQERARMMRAANKALRDLKVEA